MFLNILCEENVLTLYECAFCKIIKVYLNLSLKNWIFMIFLLFSALLIICEQAAFFTYLCLCRLLKSLCTRGQMSLFNINRSNHGEDTVLVCSGLAADLVFHQHGVPTRCCAELLHRKSHESWRLRPVCGGGSESTEDAPGQQI